MASSSLTGDALARELGRALSSNTSLNLSQNGILALLGNAGTESAGFTTGVQKSNNASGIGPGRGLIQWDGPRRDNLDRWMAENGYFPGDYMNPSVNAGFLAHELLGAEGRRRTYDIPGYGPMTVLEALRSNIPVNELVDVVHQEYERPADTAGPTPSLRSNADRQSWATRIGEFLDSSGGWNSGGYNSTDYYGNPQITPRGPEPPKDPLRPAIFNDINTILPEIPGIPGDLPEHPGTPGGGPATLERLAGFYSSDPSNTGSRYNINANDPPPAPPPPPTPDPPWMGTPESRAANEAAGRIATTQALADFRRDQADIAARGLVWNGRDWVEGGTWTGREYVPPVQEAKGGPNTGIGLTMDETGAYVPNIGGVGAPNRGWPFPSAGDLNGFPTPNAPIPVPDVSFNPAAAASTYTPIAVPTFEPVVPSFGNPSFGGGLPLYPGTSGTGGLATSSGSPAGGLGGGGGPMVLTVNPVTYY